MTHLISHSLTLSFGGKSLHRTISLPVADFGITAASLVGTPYESISKQWIENVNSFITDCTFIAHDPVPLLNQIIDTVIPAYAPSTFDAGSPQQFIVNVTSNLASDLSYEPVPTDFVSRCE